MSILGMCLSFEESTLSYIYPQRPSRTIPNRKMIAMQMADLRSAMFSFGMVLIYEKSPRAGALKLICYGFLYSRKKTFIVL